MCDEGKSKCHRHFTQLAPNKKKNMVRIIQNTTQAPNKRKQKLTDRLTKLRQKGGEDYTARIANKLNLPYVDLHIIPIASDDVLTLPENIARDLNIVCFRKRGNELTLGTPNPQDRRLLEYLDHISVKNGWDIILAVISPSSLARALTQYNHVYFVDALNTLKINLTGKDLEEFEKSIGRLLKLEDQSTSLSTTEILNIIFSGAISMGASDIHIEPQKENIRLRYRVDGVLRDIVSLPYTIHKSITARVKLMSGMKINIRDISQDGRFSFQAVDNQIDMRASTIPGKNAEGIVLRVLNATSISSSLNELGLEGKAYKDLKKTLGKTDGIILTTGPTGSGKTTTLYTIINQIKSPDKKIITVENPIEYEIDGIVQTETAHEENFTFANALRAIVRQDPDVILVGEIRDEETADVTINAALTGHLVLSTLHTNGATTTIARLSELGVKPTLMPPAINIILAQRLVRKLCECKQEHIPAQEVADNILKMVALISPKAQVKVPTKIEKIYKPIGCEKCHGSGYKGRTGIFEALTISENIEKLILDFAGETEITKTAIEEGFVTMTQDGILKALKGTTSIEEIWRVTSESGVLEELYDNLMSQTLTKRLFISKEKQLESESKVNQIESIENAIENASSEDLLAEIFTYASHLRASDIHIEPAEDKTQIRVRIDGVLQTIAQISKSQYVKLLAQAKSLANIPTSIRQGVSDGRFGIVRESMQEDSEDKKTDIRISIILGGFGETVVMRILERANVGSNIESLGITPYNLKRIVSQAQKPYGMVLNTGPTGSGKTTTLYSILNVIKTDAIKIITIEDPIEYQVSGILQTQIDKKQGYTFDTALKSLLRQDPDVILVGEIRDEETANTAVTAAQTGHLIISTLHTNNAVSTIQRLSTLGLQAPDLIAALNCIMAQRLVRKLCECKKQVRITQAQKTEIEKVLASISQKITVEKKAPKILFAPDGCETCNGLGFRGRTVVSEVLLMDTKIANLIANSALINELQNQAIEDGMLTMEQDAVLKALAGETTLEEARRATML